MSFKMFPRIATSFIILGRIRRSLMCYFEQVPKNDKEIRHMDPEHKTRRSFQSLVHYLVNLARSFI